jgi:hypothetical protein
MCYLISATEEGTGQLDCEPKEGYEALTGYRETMNEGFQNRLHEERRRASEEERERALPL